MRLLVPGICAVSVINGAAFSQTAHPQVFVANDGNLEGSISSMRVFADGSLDLVDRVITGTRTSTSLPCAGCNPFAIDLTPDGRFLATNHASGNAGEQITLVEVIEDGRLIPRATLPLAQGGLDIAWVSDTLLAVAITDLSNGSELRLYHWSRALFELTETDVDDAGLFMTSMAVHPSGEWIYTNDSFGNVVRQFEIVGETATLVDAVPIPVSGVSIEISPDGQNLYAAGGISAGGNAFAGYRIDQTTGGLTEIPGSPFTSPGASPKGFAITPDSAYLYVSHGTDATIHGFAIDAETGAPSSLGFSFDVGFQGSLQGMDTIEGRLYAADESDIFDGLEGLYAFAVDADTGAFPPVPGTPVPTEGVSPSAIVAWGGPACLPDLARDGSVNFIDINTFLVAFNSQSPIADFFPPGGGDGALNFFDVATFISAFVAGCP